MATSNSYPKDRFDAIPENLQRVGAHRAPPKKYAGWARFAWAVLVVAAIVAIGVAALFIASGRIDFGSLFGAGSESPSASPSVSASQAAPTVDPSLSVTVLNGTTTDGLASTVGDALASHGWTIGSRLNAEDRNIETTTVYYVDAADEGAARGLAADLNDAPIALSNDSAEPGAALIAVIGTDYTQPVQ